MMTFAQLEDATSHQDSIEYVGADESCFYFYANGQGYFRVRKTWSSLPPIGPPYAAGTVESPILIRVKDGKTNLVDDKASADPR